MSKYKLIQLTNTAIGQVGANEFLPLGRITRKINSGCPDAATFQITSSTADTVIINEPGYYKITYTGSLAAGAADTFSLNLVTNGTVITTASETAAAADDYVDISFIYVIRVCPNCCSAPANYPLALQLQVGDVATSATALSTSNLIIEKIY